MLYPSNQEDDVDTLVKGQGWQDLIDQMFDLQPQGEGNSALQVNGTIKL